MSVWSSHQPTTRSTVTSSRMGATQKAPGLVVRHRDYQETLVFSDQQICDDILATIPKLHSAVQNDTRGSRWKKARVQSSAGTSSSSTSFPGLSMFSGTNCGSNSVELFELEPNYAPLDRDDDLDVLHAIVGKTALRCHLNEALSVLLHQESDAFSSTMSALNGKRFRRGDVLFHQRCQFGGDNKNVEGSAAEGSTEPQHGVLSVNVMELRPTPTMHVPLTSRQKRSQKLCFATCTHQYESKDRALHVMKTIPKDVHDQVVPANERTALRRQLDHIGVGFDLQSAPAPGRPTSSYPGSSAQITRIFVHAYATDRASNAYRDRDRNRKEIGAVDAQDLARRREAYMNPEAKHVMRLLTESLSQFERVIRRRRFGFQSFVYFPKEYAGDDTDLKRCSICNKTFSFFRRDFFCQLCGHMCCRDCSQLYEVEARVGEIRKNRCCVQCVVKVDACKFDDEDLVPALGPLLVEASDEDWNAVNPSNDEASASVVSSEAEMDDLTGQLCSSDPAERSRALELLGRLVSRPTRSNSSTNHRNSQRQMPGKKNPKSKAAEVLHDIEDHVNQQLAASRHKYGRENCTINDRVRDYRFEFDGSKVQNADQPLPPMPEPDKDANRVKLIQQTGVLRKDYDHTALNMIAQVAAKRLNCPTGILSIIDDKEFHAVGYHNLPEVAHRLPRNENLCMHAVYAEQPFVLKNPQRDMRFAQMPCVQDLGIKFYASFPIHGPNGEVLGSLCATDGVAHNSISTKDYATMETLSKLASELLAPKNSAMMAIP